MDPFDALQVPLQPKVPHEAKGPFAPSGSHRVRAAPGGPLEPLNKADHDA
jgi:hypothetical protein